MRRKAKLMILMGGLTALLLVVCSGLAMAATSQNVNVSAPVASTLSLDVSKNLVNFGGGNLDPVTGNYNDSLTATVKSNVNWTLQVEKNRDLTGINPLNVIPSSQLTYTSASANPRVTQVQGSATQFGLLGTPTMVARGTKGNNLDVTVNYALNITWDDSPDTYTATHTFSVVSP
jgi:hypothetical protein